MDQTIVLQMGKGVPGEALQHPMAASEFGAADRDTVTRDKVS